MQIVLLRHGRPIIGADRWLSAAELGGWIAGYDAAGIDPGFPPPAEAIAMARDCGFTVCSDLARSIESAAALGIERPDASDPMFRELDLPFASWRLPRLSVLFWAALFRTMWALGYAPNAESISEGRLRAKQCADRLAEMAARHGRVMFVGHGALIWFIARRLLEAGWTGPRKSPRRHWDFAVYSFGGGAANTLSTRSRTRADTPLANPDRASAASAMLVQAVAAKRASGARS